jgi:hypothetical protein
MRESGIDPVLENAADKLLKEGAKRARKSDGAPYIRPNGRGYTEWAVDNGMLTKKHQEKIRQTEITGLDLELNMRPIGERHSKKENNDTD